MGRLKLKPGGLLEHSYYNEDTNKFETVDVTEHALFYLNESVEFEEIKLRDLFFLIHKNPVLYPIFGNWIEEYTESAVKAVFNDEGQRMTLELYYALFADSDNDVLHIPHCPSFHGISIADKDSEYYSEGETIKWSVQLSPIETLVDLPLVLSRTVDFGYYRNYIEDIFVKTFDTKYYTLYQVILGVVWELSFSGSPEEKEQIRAQIQASLDSIEEEEVEE